MRKFAAIALTLGLVVLVWGVWRQDYEEMASGLASIAVGMAWDFAHDRRLTGADFLNRWRPSTNKLRLFGYGLAAFAVVTAWGVWRDIIPAGLVFVMLALVVAGPVLSAPFLFFHRRAAMKAKAAEAWPHVIGQIVTSFMTEAGEWPAPIIVYSYMVEGRRHRSSRVRFGGTGGMNPAAAEQVLASYPVGAEVPVFYNPKRPRQSVLMRGQAGANKSLLWGAGCMAAVPLIGAAVLGLLVLLGLIDAALTSIVGHRVLP